MRTGPLPSEPQQAELEAVAPLLVEGLALIDGRRRLVWVNETGSRLLGRSGEELRALPLPFPCCEPAPGSETGGGAAVTGVVSVPAPGGERELDYRATPMAHGGCAVAFRDATPGRRQQRRLAAVARAASSVADADSLSVTLTALAEAVHAATDLAAVQVLTLHDDGPLLRVIGRAGFAEDPDYIDRLLECRRRGADLQMLRAVEERRPIVIPGRKTAVMADPCWAPLYPYVADLDWEDFAAVPMIVRERAVGILVVFYPVGLAPDTQSLDFLTAMADQAAMAVDYQALRAESQDRARREERERIARDLHDSVVQQVFSMRLQARALSDHCRADGPLEEARVHEAVTHMLSLSKNTLADLRDLIFELRPADLVEHGLAEALRVHAAAIEARSGLAVEVEGGQSALPLSGEAQEDLYRIVQEALHNVVKHAQAHSARVAIGQDPGRRSVVVEVSDDGRGMAGGCAERRRLGLVSMRQRAVRRGGELEIETAGARGVRVRVTMPQQPEDAGRGAGDGRTACA